MNPFREKCISRNVVFLEEQMYFANDVISDTFMINEEQQSHQNDENLVRIVIEEDCHNSVEDNEHLEIVNGENDMPYQGDSEDDLDDLTHFESADED